jgi:hypothetical protein
MPTPVQSPLLLAYPLAPDISREKRSEAVPPQPYRLMADIDPAFKEEILDVPQAQREPDL